MEDNPDNLEKINFNLQTEEIQFLLLIPKTDLLLVYQEFAE